MELKADEVSGDGGRLITRRPSAGRSLHQDGIGGPEFADLHVCLSGGREQQVSVDL